MYSNKRIFDKAGDNKGLILQASDLYFSDVLFPNNTAAVSALESPVGSFSLFTLALEVVSSLPFLSRLFLLAGGSLGSTHVAFQEPFMPFIGFNVSCSCILQNLHLCLVILDHIVMQT